MNDIIVLSFIRCDRAKKESFPLNGRFILVLLVGSHRGNCCLLSFMSLWNWRGFITIVDQLVHEIQNNIPWDCWEAVLLIASFPLSSLWNREWHWDSCLQAGLIVIDDWLKLTAPARTAVLFKELRVMLHAVLKELIKRPEVSYTSSSVSLCLFFQWDWYLSVSATVLLPCLIISNCHRMDICN